MELKKASERVAHKQPPAAVAKSKVKVAESASVPEPKVERKRASREREQAKEQEPQVIELSDDGCFDIASAIVSEEPAVVETDEEDIQEEEQDHEHDVSAAPAPTPQAQPMPTTRVLPPPRASVQSDIKFTSRVFPTPMRESKAGTIDRNLVMLTS